MRGSGPPRWAVLIVLVLAAVMSGAVAGASTTATASSTHRYDAPANARDEARSQLAPVVATAVVGAYTVSGVASATEVGRASTTPSSRCVATEVVPDFVAGPVGSQPPVPVSQSRMAAGFDEAGFARMPTSSPGMEYTLPDGSKVRLMEPAGQAPRRASFTNANEVPSTRSLGSRFSHPRRRVCR